MVKFLTSATRPEHYPATGLPEIAFYGKSNTGKSTLINQVVRRKDLVKTGSRPGMTQLINFFQVEADYVLADLPGYGYAKVPEAIRKGFKPMIDEYFLTRETLKLVLLLLDVRRTPGDSEREIVAMLASRHIKTALVITKADKVSGNELVKQVKLIAAAFGLPAGDFVVTSSLAKKGISELHTLIRSSI